jgi:uncharacterized membrane-anchored protein YitT (DUF2179 family)
MTFSLRTDGKRIFFISLAALLQAFNMKTFVSVGGLFPGGVTGLTVLIQRCALRYLNIDLPYTPVNLLINAIPVYIGFRFVGKKLTLYSFYFIILSSFLTDLFPLHAITQDTLLISIFGGMINGFLVSICLQMNANTGGTDFISLFLSERTGIDSFNVILGVNVVILSVAGLLFGWDKALYSIIFQFFSTQVIHLRFQRYQQTTLFIVTNSAKEVSKAISRASNHGATIMHGEGSYSDEKRDVVYSVVSSAESKQVIKAIIEVDPGAFVNSLHTEALSGWFYRKPAE